MPNLRTTQVTDAISKITGFTPRVMMIVAEDIADHENKTTIFLIMSWEDIIEYILNVY
ncbi:hypothetical protein AMTR_s00072p00080490, partial [Amborella trichopoda]